MTVPIRLVLLQYARYYCRWREVISSCLHKFCSYVVDIYWCSFLVIGLVRFYTRFFKWYNYSKTDYCQSDILNKLLWDIHFYSHYVNPPIVNHELSTLNDYFNIHIAMVYCKSYRVRFWYCKPVGCCVAIPIKVYNLDDYNTYKSLITAPST